MGSANNQGAWEKIQSVRGDLSQWAVCRLVRPYREDSTKMFLDSWPMETEIIHLCYFKPLSLDNLLFSNKKLIKVAF